jgi:AcrR family transcriptional regulator
MHPEQRPRDSATRREEILEAARTLFLRDSYENVGVRDVAAAARVDPALVHRYAGSKDELFAEVLARSGDPSVLFAGGREDFGARIAAMLVDEPQYAGKLDGLLIMLRSASSPKAITLIKHSMESRFYSPMAKWLGGRDAAVRAQLIGALIMGASFSRAVTGDYGLNDAGKAKLRSRIAASLQDLVDG